LVRSPWFQSPSQATGIGLNARHLRYHHQLWNELRPKTLRGVHTTLVYVTPQLGFSLTPHIRLDKAFNYFAALYMASWHSSGDWQFKQSVTMALPTEILKAGWLRCWAARFAEARLFFARRAGLVPTGLEELPSRWLQQLPRHLESRDMGPFMITSLAFDQGFLCVAFAHEVTSQTGRMTMWDDLRFVLNLSLQPNIWHPLARKEELEVWNRCPKLRGELFALD
jgi:hypothetical protein